MYSGRTHENCAYAALQIFKKRYHVAHAIIEPFLPLIDVLGTCASYEKCSLARIAVIEINMTTIEVK